MAPIAFIHGLGAVCAAGGNVEALVQAVRAHRPLLAPCPRFRNEPWADYPLGSIPSTAWEELGERLPDVREQPALRLALATARQAMEQAQPALAHIPPDRRGLVLATTKGEIGALEEAVNLGRDPAPAAAAAQPYALAAGLARRLDLRGPIQAVSLACASGLLALQQAAALIQRGEADAALAVGVDLLSTFVVSGFYALRSMDPGGCRPFDRDRRGLSPGEAAAAVLLTREATRGRPLGRLLGWGSSDDANHLTGPSRDGGGLALALARALRHAGLDPAGVAFVHVHGTGTPYNDAMEWLALRTVFGNRPPAFASSKAITGHTMGAAGVLETVLTLATARAGFWPGTPGLAIPDAAAPSSLTRHATPAADPAPFLKMNSGFGGINAALVLEACGP
jgi:3-oxoacyl-[acyl-carrier-protein] synthase II